MSNKGFIFSGVRLLKARAYAIAVRALESTGLDDKPTANTLVLLKRRLEKFDIKEAFKLSHYGENGALVEEKFLDASDFFLNFEQQLAAHKHTTRKFTGKLTTVSRVTMPDGTLVVVEFNR